MQFSIITPSFRNSHWLKLCIASVADQGVEVEHIVQDSCSDDGTQDWLPGDPRVTAFIEKDKGMYDAVNRGLRRAQGEILAYINCDEQYLPGALRTIADYFQTHPRVEIVFSDAIVIDADGRYMCHRCSMIPGKYHSWVSGNLAILTCATFFRRSVIDRRSLFFEAGLRDAGDAVWVLNLIEQNVPMGLLPHFTSVFTETGENMNLKPNARREKAELFAKAPIWARRATPFVVLLYRLRRLLKGHYRKLAPFDYSIFTRASPDRRVTFHASEPTFRFRRSNPTTP